MEKLGLQLLLAHGHFLSVVLPKKRALEIVTAWTKGQISTGRLNEETDNGGMWTVDSSQIVAMHTFPPEQLKQALQQQGNANAVAQQGTTPQGWPVASGNRPG